MIHTPECEENCGTTTTQSFILSYRPVFVLSTALSEARLAVSRSIFPGPVVTPISLVLLHVMTSQHGPEVNHDLDERRSGVTCQGWTRKVIRPRDQFPRKDRLHAIVRML